VTEGISGLRYVNGFPGEPPVRPNLSIGDTIAGIHAALGILIALWDREMHTGGKQGQVVDVALYESIFNLMEGVVPEFSGAGVVREASGTTITGIVPTNTYKCRDGRFVVIGGNGDSIFKRLMGAIGRADLAADPQLAGNTGRVARVAEIDAAIGAWTTPRRAVEVLEALNAVNVPAGRIYTAKDIAEDPHYRARGMIERITSADGLSLEVPGIVPKLSLTPGAITRRAPTLGEDTEAVLARLKPQRPA
jgi:formyl-CoA transferase